MTEPLFLNEDELIELTGRKTKSLQIEELKRMMIAFRVNALGKPVVTRAAVVGHTASAASSAPEKWKPSLAV